MRDKTIRVSLEFDDWLEQNKGCKTKVALTDDLAKALKTADVVPVLKKKTPLIDFDFRITKSRKGSINDWFVIPVILFVFALIILVGYKLMTDLNTEFQANPDLATESKTIMQDNKNAYVNVFDKSYLVVIIFLIIASIIGAIVIDTHPVIVAVALPLLVIALLFSAILGNTFASIIEAEDLAVVGSEFVVIPYVWNHIVQIMLFAITAIAIGLFAKVRAWLG